MRYRKFIIKGYRGISTPIEINVQKESIIPIIGKNESGKTTCLEAINTFDYYNDSENGGTHLSNIDNLYFTEETPIIISAEIEVDRDYDLESNFKPQFEAIKKEFLTKNPQAAFDMSKVDTDKDALSNLEYLRGFRMLTREISESKSIQIERDLRTKQYTFPLLRDFLDDEFLNTLGRSFIKELPYILYFDDFRDRMPEKIYVVEDEKSPNFSNWINHIDELFSQTKKEYSVFTLLKKQDGIRKSIIVEVQNHLNGILTQEWSKYQFDNQETIQIKIDYQDVGQGPFLSFNVIENVLIGGKPEDRFFEISHRSKGFFWFFNFMFKLHFNPKKRSKDDLDTIYLLDEPGSYLHSYALNKLADQLKRLSKNNKVIYCTHFHNLLNPDFIPINAIRVAEKINKGEILLKSIRDAELIRPKTNAAFQPIFDALEVKPPLIEYDYDNIILLEGIYDFYSFRMFTNNMFAYFPCVSASSMINQIPYMIFLGKSYLALWDNDDEGKAQMKKATELFGEREAQRFLILEAIPDQTKTRLEEYYDEYEISQFRTLELKISNLGFNKTIIELFFIDHRDDIIDKYFQKTKANFLNMAEVLRKKLDAQKNPE